LLSWVFLRGGCRYCCEQISALYPLIEIAAIFVAFWPVIAVDNGLVWASCFGWTLLVLVVIDCQTLTLPDALTLTWSSSSCAPVQRSRYLLGSPLLCMGNTSTLRQCSPTFPARFTTRPACV
jgi:prepilin signal peptidase PulO-like enzyme (type II secretory pathway)